MIDKNSVNNMSYNVIPSNPIDSHSNDTIFLNDSNISARVAVLLNDSISVKVNGAYDNSAQLNIEDAENLINALAGAVNHLKNQISNNDTEIDHDWNNIYALNMGIMCNHNMNYIDCDTCIAPQAP